MDSVALDALQRLDLEDANALQALVYAYTSELLGTILGPGSGCITKPVFSIDGDNVSVGAFQFYHSEPAKRANGTVIETDGVPKAHKGITVLHDPQDDGQASESTFSFLAFRTIAEAAYAPGSGYGDDFLLDINAYPWLWARPYSYRTDTDARKKWDTSTTQEESYSPKTRYRQRVEFRLQVSQPIAAAGEHEWVKVARIVSWGISGGSLSDPVFEPLSLWDGLEGFELVSSAEHIAHGVAGMLPSPLRLASSTIYSDFPNTPGTGAFLTETPSDEGYQAGAPVTSSLGLIRLLTMMRERQARHVSNVTSTAQLPWWKLPEKGLKELTDLIGDFFTAAGSTQLVLWAAAHVSSVPGDSETVTGFGLIYDGSEDSPEEGDPYSDFILSVPEGLSLEPLSVSVTADRGGEGGRSTLDAETIENEGVWRLRIYRTGHYADGEDLTTAWYNFPELTTSSDDGTGDHTHTVDPDQHDHDVTLPQDVGHHYGGRLRAWVIVIGKKV